MFDTKDLKKTIAELSAERKSLEQNARLTDMQDTMTLVSGTLIAALGSGRSPWDIRFEETPHARIQFLPILLSRISSRTARIPLCHQVFQQRLDIVTKSLFGPFHGISGLDLICVDAYSLARVM